MASDGMLLPVSDDEGAGMAVSVGAGGVDVADMGGSV